MIKNKSFIFLPLISGILAACGQFPMIEDEFKITITHFVDPEFKPYYDRFVSASSAISGKDLSGEKVTIKFVDSIPSPDPDAYTLGLCYFDLNLVEISREAWDNLLVGRREALIFHELGHCLLKRKHDDAREQTSGKMLSIMNTYLISTKEFISKYDYYLMELFLNPKVEDLVAFNSPVSTYTDPFPPSDEIVAASVRYDNGDNEAQDLETEIPVNHDCMVVQKKDQ